MTSASAEKQLLTPEQIQRISKSPVYFAAEEVLKTDGEGDNWLTFSFASEKAVKRWYGTLTLRCMRGAVLDETVRKNGCPFLLDHNSYQYDNHVGMVRRVYLKGKVAYADVEFNKDKERSMELYRDMLSGMRPGISLMPEPPDEEDIEIKSDGNHFPLEVTFKRWEPMELSSVSMAANVDIGIGPKKLSADVAELLSDDSKLDRVIRRYIIMPDEPTQVAGSGEGTTAVQEPEKLNAQPVLSAEQLTAIVKQVSETMAANQAPSPSLAVQQPHAPIDTEEIKQLRASAASAAELERKTEIQSLGIQFGHTDLVQEWLDGGKPANDFQKHIMTLNFHPGMPTGGVKAELDGSPAGQGFSFARLARAKLLPESKEAQEEAQFELHAGESLAGNARQGGLVVPFAAYAKGGAVLPAHQMMQVQNRAERLAVTVDGNTGAKNAVVTMVDLDRTVDFLVDPLDIMMYCDVAMGLQGDVQVPIETGGATLGFNAEGSVQAESTPTFGNYKASPNMLSAYVKVTKQSILQTGGWIERRIRMLLQRQFRSQINNYILNGTGSANNQPNGLRGTTDLPFADAGVITGLSWAKVVEHEEVVDNQFIPDMGRAWVMSQGIYGRHLSTQKAINTGIFLIQDKGGPLMGSPAMKTSFIGGAEVIGGTTYKGQVIYGNWLDMFVGFWDGFEVVIDGITEPANVKITVMIFWDAICARKESFAVRAYT